MSDKLAVAKTILEQLGGGRFMAMCGVKNFVGSEDGLSFSLPKKYNGINKVQIKLTPADLYEVTFYFFSAKTLECKVVKKVDDVYCDMLQEVFTDATGLYTRL